MHSAIFRSVRMLATYFQMIPECVFTERYIQYGKMLKLVNRDEECMYYIFHFFVGLNIFKIESWEKVIQGRRIQG